MPDLFKDYIKSIMETGKNHMETKEDEKTYVPFVVNRAMSFYPDTVLLANEMNMLPNTSKRSQYAFLINTVRKTKRPYRQWVKYSRPEDLDVVMEYYECSVQKAKDILSLLTSEQVDEIKRLQQTGGIENDKLRRPSMGQIQGRR